MTPQQPTMDDVASRAGVSRALVSLVMRDSPKVSEGSRAAVLAAADELGYRPNLMARNLASRRTMTIGVVLNDLHNPFFAEIHDGIQEGADDFGYRTVINTGRRSLEYEQAAVDTFLQFRTDGIIMVGARLESERLDELATETQLVVVGRATDAGRYDTVNTDDELGARLVVDHLVQLGHERIAHIDGGEGAGAKERRTGYVAAMRSHGLEDHIAVARGAFTERAGDEGARELLQLATPPTAIFAANDLMATGVLDRLQQEGLDVPGEVSLVGYDNTALAALGHMGLSTVNQPTETLGRLAVQCLIERLDHQRDAAVHHVLAPSLVPRTTSGPAPSSTT